jgi:hypothetical protein
MNQRLIEEINIDLHSMEIIVNDVKTLLEDLKNDEADNIQKTALGGLVSQFYNGVENILKRILKHSSVEIPKGSNWHIELLNMFTIENFKKNRLQLFLNSYLLEELSNYRRFRHYFFHGYSHNLNWAILNDAVKDISDVFNAFRQVLHDSYFKSE